MVPIFGAYQLSYRILRGGDARYFSIDYRINLSLKCYELDSLTDMVKSRRRLVIVNLIYLLVTTSSMTIAFYFSKNPLCIIPSLACENEIDITLRYMTVVVLAWYAAGILSFLQNVIELLYILIAKKSFLDWAFKAGLKQREVEN